MMHVFEPARGLCVIVNRCNLCRSDMNLTQKSLSATRICKRPLVGGNVFGKLDRSDSVSFCEEPVECRQVWNAR